MSLAPLALDDLDWTAMVEAVRGKIAGASAGLWTHHAAVDPGVTLLELFGWLIEQRLYWIDQTPDAQVRALVALLGEIPRPARAARTLLAVTSAAGQARALPAGVRFRPVPRGATAPPEFTSQDDLTLLPVERMGLRTVSGDQEARLHAGRPVALLPVGNAPAEVRVRLWLRAPAPPPTPTAPMALFFDIVTPLAVAAAWAPDAVAAPPPALLSWWHSTGTGSFARFDDAEVQDGTGGLRRAGVVRLPVPSGWGPDDDGAFVIALRAAQPAYTSPPLLRRLLPNVVVAEHWKHVEVEPAELRAQARRWLRLPGQTLELPADEPPPLTSATPSTGDSGPVALRLRERDGVHDWRAVPDLAFADSDDRVFLVDRYARRLVFGDGIAGRVPVPADPVHPELDLHYRAGGGELSLAAGVAPDGWEAATDLDLTAWNPVAAIGGAEAETAGSAAARTGFALAEPRRAVVRRDYEDLARTTPGVAIARAHAAIGRHPDHPCVAIAGAVSIFVVPSAPRPDDESWDLADPAVVHAPVADPGALAAVQARLDQARLVTTAVFVMSPRYRPVSLAVVAAADPIDALGTRRRLARALARFLDPLIGGDDGEGWPFGAPLRPSALVRSAAAVLASDGAVSSVAIGLDGRPPTTSCDDVDIGRFDLVYLTALDVRFESVTSQTGGLP